MLILPFRAGASLAVRDDECLRSVPRTVPVPETINVGDVGVCLTCFSCGLTVESPRCPCRVLDVSCCRLSWMLTAEARTFVNVLYELCGPVMLTDQDWDAVLEPGRAAVGRRCRRERVGARYGRRAYGVSSYG